MRPIPLGRNYRAIVCDPPWAFELYSAAGEEKSAQAQYNCMDAQGLRDFAREINLDFICAPDCALVMWATFPMLPEALVLLKEWGFTYKSGGSWAKLTTGGKPAFGTGYIFRSAAEIFLLGVRGSPVIRSHSVRNLIMAERREHSVKPDELQEAVEQLFDGPYLELFARRRRPRWDSFGDHFSGFVSADDPL